MQFSLGKIFRGIVFLAFLVAYNIPVVGEGLAENNHDSLSIPDEATDEQRFDLYMQRATEIINSKPCQRISHSK